MYQDEVGTDTYIQNKTKETPLHPLEITRIRLTVWDYNPIDLKQNCLNSPLSKY